MKDGDVLEVPDWYRAVVLLLVFMTSMTARLESIVQKLASSADSLGESV